ncbi:olfactory receptor 1-like [Chanos chanos]|uniref:Olfactory receptor 1-like n=1 Tax=Chanos chanos TaxID=29144 RepID=A0A6J2WV65_CHACN|nr:olfactory receptor 1-like [Chanos chanos]
MPIQPVSANTTFVRPSTFYINGFSNVPHAKYYYIFLCLVYTTTVFGNSFIMCTICLARTLHTAKYIAVFNLAVTDLGGSTALIPKLIETFLFEHQYISYEACLANMFFVFFFMTLQSLTLLLLAYDRVVAICFPLRYHATVTKTAMASIVGCMWVFSTALVASTVALITRLSFCRSTVINGYFCDHGPIYKLACNDYSLNDIMGFVCTASILCIPFILITISYACIAVALLRIAQGTARIKAMKTCTSHLILVAVFYLPIFSIYAAAWAGATNANARIISYSLTQTIPSMLNPFIYTINTEEVRQSMRGLYKRAMVNNTTEKNTMRTEAR